MKMSIEKIIGIETTVLLALIVLTVLFKYLKSILHRDAKLVKFATTIPGPPALPLIGNGFDFLLKGTINIPKVLSECGKKYGRTYRLWLGNRLLVGLAEVDDLQAVLSHPNTINKSDLFLPYANFFDYSVFAFKSEQWKQSRKILQPTFSKQVVKARVPVINDTIKYGIAVLEKHVDGPEFNLLDYLPYLATDSFTETFLSIKLGWEKLKYFELHHILNFIDEMIVPRIFMPFHRLKWVGNLIYGNEVRRAKDKMKLLTKLILKDPETFQKDARDDTDLVFKGTNSPQKSLVSAVFKIRDKINIRAPFFENINDISTTVTVSTHTSSATNASLLVAIAIYPEIQERLYNEIHNLFGEEDRPATYEDTLKLQYLDQVLKETLRRFTVVPFIFRTVDEDTDIGSMVIPKGTQLMLRFIDVHWDPKWYRNPHEFNPENFSPEAVANRPKYTYLPFAAGTRDCIGKYYAEVSMKLTIIELVRRYKFYTTMKLTDINSIASFTTNVPGGYRISIKRR